MDPKFLSNFSIVEGDLLNAFDKYIVYQTGFRVRYGLGIAKVIFEKLPYANIYVIHRGATPKGARYSEPGTIDLRGGLNGNHRGVINIMGQDGPGRGNVDVQKTRKAYFQSGLTAIAMIEDLESVAFPYGIGCGLAGGVWSEYETMLRTFAEEIAPVSVILYKLPAYAQKVWPTTLQAEKRKRQAHWSQNRKKNPT